MDNISQTHKNIEELQSLLGERIRAYRVGKNIGQAEVAAKADVSLRTLVSLEKEGAATIGTLLRVLRALGLPEPLDALAPKPQVSPMALLRSPSPPRRASRKKPDQP